MDASGKLDPDLSLDEIMRRWPATIRVVIRHGMLCVGCPINVFHTVAEACDAHGIDRTELENELSLAMRGDVPADAPRAEET